MRTVPLLVLALAVPALADGFHSPLLREQDPRKWAKTVRENLGLDRSDSAEDAAPADAFDRRAAAGNLLDVLRYLDRRNVILREFPNFNYDDIPGFRSETETLLVAIGADAVPILVETLLSDLRLGPGRAEPDDLKRAEDFVERVVRILVAIGPPVLSRAVPLLADEDPKVRTTFLRIVREIVREPDFGPDAKAWTRWFGIREAGRSRDPAAVPLLVAALEDPDRRIRLAAARSLGEVGHRQAVPALLALLADRTDLPTIREVARALAKIGDPIAVTDLVALLESPVPEVREEVVTALRFLTKQSFGFDPRGTPEERAAAVLRWRAWVGNR